MPMFADAYISSLCFLRPNVLFENNGERARTSAEGDKEKSPTSIPLRWRSINLLQFIFYHPTDFEEKIEGLWTGYASIRKYAFPS